MYDDTLDLYSRPYDLSWEEEERRRLAEPAVEPVPLPPEAPPPEPPVPEGFVPIEEPPKAEAPPEPPIPEGFVEMPPIPEGFIEMPEEKKPESEPFSLGDLAYRAVTAPVTSPLSGPVAKAAIDYLAPAGTRQREFMDRIGRNWDTAVEETQAGVRQKAANFLSAEQNPYLGKSIAEAKADVPRLKQQIAEAEKNLIASGGDPNLVGQEWYDQGAPENAANMVQSQRVNALRKRLVQAQETATGAGVSTESFAGTLSRSFEDVAQADRERKAEIIKEYAPLIQKSRDSELWMKVADSLGSSGPSMAGSMLNPIFGLALMYAQTFENSRSEFLEKGGDPAKADEYGDVQATVQTPLEILGEIPLVGIGKGVLKRLAKEGNPGSWANWIKERAVELGKSFAGEVGVTTPGQTIIEQKVGEQYGIKPPKSWDELMGDVWEAQKVAGLQIGIAGGGPVAVEAGMRGITGAGQAPVVGAPPLAPGPVAGTVPGVTIASAPGEVPTPPDLAGAAAAPTYGGIHPIFGGGTYTEPLTGEVIAVPLGSGAEQLYWNGKPTDRVRRPDGSYDFATDVESADPNWAQPEVTKSSIDARAEETPAAPVVPEPPISADTAGQVVVQKTQSDNEKIQQVADTQAQNLQAVAAPKTAEAIQQVAQRANTEASVTAAQFLKQAQAKAAEEAVTGIVPPPLPAEAKAQTQAEAPVQPGEFAQPGYTAVAPAAPDLTAPAATPAPAAAAAAPAVTAPAAGAPAGPTPAIVVGGQVFTGNTPAQAFTAAHNAVGPDAMRSAETGWVDPESGRFVTHAIYDAHQTLNAAIETAGGDMAHPSVAQAGVQLAEAQARDEELQSQILQPGGEQVVQPGIKGQEVLVTPRPSQALAVPLAGVTVQVEGVTPEGQPTVAERPAAQALNDAKNDHTALTILLDCLS